MLAAFARTASRRTMLSAAARTHARMASSFMTQYQAKVAERAEMGIVPQPLDAGMTSQLVELLQNPPKEEEAELFELLSTRVPPGVDEAAYVKAGFLAAVAKGEAKSPVISAEKGSAWSLGRLTLSRDAMTALENGAPPSAPLA